MADAKVTAEAVIAEVRAALAYPSALDETRSDAWVRAKLSFLCDLAERGCGTCRHQGESGDGPVCYGQPFGVFGPYGKRALLCEEVGNRCGRWEEATRG